VQRPSEVGQNTLLNPQIEDFRFSGEFLPLRAWISYFPRHYNACSYCTCQTQKGWIIPDADIVLLVLLLVLLKNRIDARFFAGSTVRALLVQVLFSPTAFFLLSEGCVFAN
jgi:hypothetical protein